jgi:hypothetical protein
LILTLICVSRVLRLTDASRMTDLGLRENELVWSELAD